MPRNDTSASRDAYGLSEAAARLGVHVRTVRRLAECGSIRTIRIARRVLIPTTELERILREGSR